LSSEKIEQVRTWLGEITRPWDKTFHVVEDTGWGEVTWGEWTTFEQKLSVLIYTRACRYRITAIDRQGEEGYLGCIVSARFPRPGECWRRGNDLPDGHLTRETWEAIKDYIIGYELVKPAPQETAEATTFELLVKALQGAFIAMRMTKQGGHWILPDLAKAWSHGGEDVPKEISDKVIDHLCSIMQDVPVEMLPELLVSGDLCVREAAARRSKHKEHGGAN